MVLTMKRTADMAHNYAVTEAQAGQRAKEVALRMTLGARRAQLFVQHLGESLFITFIAALVAITLVEISLPFYRGMLNRELIFELLNPQSLAIFSVLVLMIGMVAGLYPATIISAFRPVKNLNAAKPLKLTGSVCSLSSVRADNNG